MRLTSPRLFHDETRRDIRPWNSRYFHPRLTRTETVDMCGVSQLAESTRTRTDSAIRRREASHRPHAAPPSVGAWLDESRRD